MDRFKSRKFWLTLGGSIAVVLVTAVFDVPAEDAEKMIAGLVGIIGPYVLGQGYVDGKSKEAGR